MAYSGEDCNPTEMLEKFISLEKQNPCCARLHIAGICSIVFSLPHLGKAGCFLKFSQSQAPTSSISPDKSAKGVKRNVIVQVEEWTVSEPKWNLRACVRPLTNTLSVCLELVLKKNGMNTYVE